MNKLSKAGIYLYGTGVGGFCLTGIYEENVNLDEKTKNCNKYVNINIFDYTMHSIGGACTGFTCGLFWPFVVIGRTMVAIDNIITINKNN